MYWNAWRDPSSTWLREQRSARPCSRERARRRPGLHRPDELIARHCRRHAGSPAARAHSSRPTTATRTIGRCWPCRSIRPSLLARRSTSTSAGRAACRAPSRAPASSALLLHRAVVSRRSACSRTRAGTVTSFTRPRSSSPTTAPTTCSLTVPSGWIVGATGREQSKTDNGNGTTTHRYVEPDVHDFAWTTSPDFVDVQPTGSTSPACRRVDAAPAAPAGARGPGRSPFRRGRARVV